MAAEKPPWPRQPGSRTYKGGFTESQHGFGQIIESTPSRPRRYHLVQITDAGSVPCSTETPQEFESFRTNPHEPARTRRNPHQPARPDARPLIFNKLLDRSALADCGRSMGWKSGSSRRPPVPPRCKTSVLVDIYRRNGTFQPALTCAATDWLVEICRHDSS